jgi:hypothetical protein
MELITKRNSRLRLFRGAAEPQPTNGCALHLLAKGTIWRRKEQSGNSLRNNPFPICDHEGSQKLDQRDNKQTTNSMSQ